MTLAIFDLDNTLIAGDSDTLWGEYLCERGYVDANTHLQRHQQYYQDYQDGNLNIIEFLSFQLEILGKHDMETLHQWRQDYLQEMIKPIIPSKALDRVEAHRQQGHHLLIITATNRFITEPIAQLFGIDDLIATEPEILAGEYSGQLAGIPSFAEGKVIRLNEWLTDKDLNLEGSWFYSDSHNDLPLLKQVDHAVAVDADERLSVEAKQRGWDRISLRD